MADPSTRHQEMREIWNDYNDRQAFEHELIDRKTRWLLGTQAILFAAYGVTFQSESAGDVLREFRDIVAWSGIAIAITVFIGVCAHIIAKRLSWKEYKKFFDKETVDFFPLNRRELRWGVKTRLTPWGLAPDMLLPLIFIGAWCYLALGEP